MNIVDLYVKQQALKKWNHQLSCMGRGETIYVNRFLIHIRNVTKTILFLLGQSVTWVWSQWCIYMFQNECKWWLYSQRLSTSSESKLILNNYDPSARCCFKWVGGREVECPTLAWYSFLYILRIWIYKFCLSHPYCFFN